MFIATITLIILAVTGYDQYIATRIRAKVLASSSHTLRPGSSSSLAEVDPHTRMRIKKVKAVKVGSYLVITLVISENSSSGDRVEVDDPSLLIPLVSAMDEEEGVEAIS